MIVKRIGLGLVAATLAWLPAQPAYAIFHWCKGCGTPVVAGYAPAPVVPYSAGYAPYVASYAPACPLPCGSACVAPCAQTVSYVPQVSYRTVYYNTPVVAYRPMTACGLCGPTTVMRPVTTYVTAARLVAYTSYSPVVSGCAPSPCAMGACGVAAPVATAVSYPPVAPAPACCSASYAAPTGASYPPAVTAGYTAPAAAGATQTYAPIPAAPSAPAAAPSYSSPGPTPSSTYPSNPTPLQPQPSGQSQPNQTFENPSDQPAPEPQSRIVLPPRSINSTTSGAPRALDPEDALDQSTAIPLRRSVAMRPVSTSVAPQSTDLSDQGWRSARKQ